MAGKDNPTSNARARRTARRSGSGTRKPRS